TAHELASDGVVPQAHFARGAGHGIVRDAGVIRPGIDVQADGALVEGVGDAVDAVLSLLESEDAFRRARDAAVRQQANALARAGAVEAPEVLQPESASLDRKPAELPGSGVHGARGLWV